MDKKLTSKMKLIIAAAVITFVVALLIIVFGLNTGNELVKLENSGVVFYAEGGLFKDKGSTNKLKISKKNNIETISFFSSIEFDDLEDVSTDIFSFSLNGVPDNNILLDATITSQNMFLKKGSYGEMVKTKVKEKEFRPGKYYYSEDGKNFRLVNTFDSKQAKRYYLFNKIGTVEEDYYPVTYKLKSDYVVEGLNVNSNASGDSLLRIANVIISALSSNQKFETSFSDGLSKKNPHTTVYSVNNVEYINKTDLRSWVKLTEEKLSWERNDEQSERAEEILNVIKEIDQNGSIKRKKTVIVIYANENNAQRPLNARAVDSNDFCLSTSFGIDISFSSAESVDEKGEM